MDRILGAPDGEDQGEGCDPIGGSCGARAQRARSGAGDGIALAIPHAPGNDGTEPVELYTFADYPDGGLFASAADLAKLLGSLARRGEGILSAATLAEMMKPQVTGLDPHQGLGWYRDQFGGRTWWAHDGAETGVAARLLFDPATGNGLVLLANGEDEGDAFGNVTELLIDRLDELAR